jgi:excisionase family DNA binding protein
MKNMSENKTHARKLAARATRAFALPDPSQAGVLSSYHAPIYHASQWLCFAEAAAYTGLPQSTLRKLLANRKLPALDTGPRFGGRWRFKRSDLDAISAI